MIKTVSPTLPYPLLSPTLAKRHVDPDLVDAAKAEVGVPGESPESKEAVIDGVWASSEEGSCPKLLRTISCRFTSLWVTGVSTSAR